MRRLVATVTVAAVLTIVGIPPAGAGAGSEPANVQFRPVLAELSPANLAPVAPLTNAADVVRSCDVTAVLALPSIPSTAPTMDFPSSCAVLEAGASIDDAGLRFYLGRAEFDGGAVKRAARTTSGGEQQAAIDLVMTHAGKRALNRLAADLYEKQPPMNQMAVVVDGVVIAAPAFQASSFPGGIQFTGNFTIDDARGYAKIINASRWLSRFCTATAMMSVPEDYVGSTRHVTALKALERDAPKRLARDLVAVREYVAQNVDPADPDSQLIDDWPAGVVEARDRIYRYARTHCR